VHSPYKLGIQSLGERCVELPASPLAVALPHHPDEHRPERPILLAVDQELGEGATLRGSPRTRRSARARSKSGSMRTWSNSARGARDDYWWAECGSCGAGWQVSRYAESVVTTHRRRQRWEDVRDQGAEVIGRSNSGSSCPAVVSAGTRAMAVVKGVPIGLRSGRCCARRRYRCQPHCGRRSRRRQCLSLLCSA
jgi:hypothetical protein